MLTFRITTFSRLLQFALAIALMSTMACNPNDHETIEILSDSNAEEVYITSEQFESSDMKLGNLEEKVFSTTIQANGMIDVPPENKANVSTYYGGFVARIKLLPGQRISKGEVMFTLTNPEYVQMQQDFLEIQSKLSYLKEDYERQQTLARDNIASRKNFVKAETDYNVALAMYESLKKKLLLININPAKISDNNLKTNIVIYAPISGFVTKVNATMGMYLNPTDVAVELVDSDHIHLELNVFEKDIQKVKIGQDVRFKLPDVDGIWYDAEVHLVGKTVEGDNRTVNVHGHLKDESLATLFIPGMYVESQITTESSKVMALPEDAVVNVGNESFVLVKLNSSTDGLTFEKRQVVPGQTENKWLEILNPEDFKSTDQILTKGGFNLIN